MRGTLTITAFLASFLSITQTSASEQQPFEFSAMSAPQYTLPPLPYAYDVSYPQKNSTYLHIANHL